MRPGARALWAACVLGLCLACFGPALVGGRQFGYRDAAHYYYPLYERVEQEWNAGRVPLWEPEENAGMPLLGNPTAAVLYPGKLIYRLASSYAWGARWYTVSHAVLAAVGMFVLARGWSISRVGSGLAALAYAFGVPVLFQYCNIIYLVGAAWLPLGLRAADAWLRERKRVALVGLALVLAMQTLGGDPQAAYLTGLVAAFYAWMLARRRGGTWGRVGRVGAGRRVLFVVACVLGWLVLGVLAAWWLARPKDSFRIPPEPIWWTPWASLAIRVGWLLLAARMLWVCWKRPAARGLGVALSGLLISALVALALTGAQLLPVLEFTSRSARAADSGPHDVYPFSVEPVRLAELVWPSVFGSHFGGNTNWLAVIPPQHRLEVWVPSLYLGGLVVPLAVVGCWGGVRLTWRRWLLVVTVLAVLASMGKFASPIWLARCVPAWTAWIGPHDSFDTAAIRFDGHLRDGDGGFYWLFTTFLPGFGAFRYPGKLMTLASLGLAVLAGVGCDRVLRGRGRVALRVLGGFWVLTLVLLVGVWAGRAGIVGFFEASPLARGGGMFGPFLPAGAWRATVQSLAHGALVLGAGVWLAWAARWRRWRGWAAGGLVLVQALDLGAANARFVVTVPQALFDARPELLRLIEQAEAEAPMAGGHYRVHRMPLWNPQAWAQQTDERRHERFAEWEHKTIQPKYAVPHGMQYTMTEGVAELYDYLFFFAPFEAVTQDPNVDVAFLGRQIDKRLVAHPRRGFDMWNTRYFVLPYVPGNDGHRGFASFLPRTKPLYPKFEEPPGAERTKRIEQWGLNEDWQLLRNEAAYPRVWVVHDAKVERPIVGLGRKDRDEKMQEILYQNDPLWSVEGRVIYEPRQMAWVETERPDEVRPFVTRTAVQASEAPRIVRYEPQRVEIEVDMQTPGLVILADVFYPGWKLTVDGQPAPIFRTNRMMRGAGVPSGKHQLVYTYEPDSFRYGLMMSGAGVLGLLVLGAWAWRGRREGVGMDRTEIN